MSTPDNTPERRPNGGFDSLDAVDFFDDGPGDTTRRPLRASLLPFARQMRELLEAARRQSLDQQSDAPSKGDES